MKAHITHSRRGFFGALAGLAALPLFWRKYPPVTALPIYRPDDPRIARSQAIMCRAKAGDVLHPVLPADDVMSAARRHHILKHWNARGDEHYVVTGHRIDRRFGRRDDPETWKPHPAFEALDHRPTWSEVREILKYPPVNWLGLEVPGFAPIVPDTIRHGDVLRFYVFDCIPAWQRDRWEGKWFVQDRPKPTRGYPDPMPSMCILDHRPTRAEVRKLVGKQT